MAHTRLGATWTDHAPRALGGAIASCPLGPVIFCHGHNANNRQAAQGWAFGNHPVALADEGFYAYALDLTVATGPSSFACAATDTALKNGIDAVLALGGWAKTNLFAWSGGCGDVIALLAGSAAYAAKVDRVLMFAPQTDADWAADLVLYTPAYDEAGITPPAGWKTEYDAIFSPSYAVGVVAPYRLRDQADEYASRGVRTHIVQPVSDTSLPPEASEYWAGLAEAAYPGVVTFESIAGGHTALGNVPTAQSIAFFRKWAA